jgi:hypothetical protein
LMLKFEQMGPLGEWFARRLAELVKREPEVLEADWWFQYRYTGNEKRSGGITKRR